MKLYIHPLSPPALGVMFTAEAIGLRCDKAIINLAKGEQRSPEYAAINPKGKVPAMDDDGFILSESAAIMRYLAKRENSPLYPKGTQAQAKVDEWMDYIAIIFVRLMAAYNFTDLSRPCLDRNLIQRQ